MLAAFLALGIIFTGCGNETAENSAAAKTNEKFPAFTAKNLAGETVTNEIFAQKKITVVNIWGTFCPPCIGEMPELGNWAKNMPADAQLIGIVCDVSGTDNLDAAKKILSDADANFLNVVPSAELQNFLQNFEFVPTTVFVDAQGNLIGEPVIGADVDGYKKRVEDFLNG